MQHVNRIITQLTQMQQTDITVNTLMGRNAVLPLFMFCIVLLFVETNTFMSQPAFLNSITIREVVGHVY